jgi:phospholipid/cholesterol/gamma-HCH transport system substrate-binding protein
VRRALLLLLASTTLVSALAACGGRGTYTLYAEFDDVGDLVDGHSVQIADVRVGEVTGIELTGDHRARITLAVDGDVQVPARVQAYLRTTSLLGEKFIELRPLDEENPARGPFLEDGDELEQTAEAPELELITDQAVRLLGGVISTDLATLIETGAEGFGGREEELRSLVEDLSTISRTLAQRTDAVTTIIDRLGGASATLADGRDDVDALFVDLAEATRVLREDRDRTITAIRELSRLARVQNEAVFDRYLDDVSRQLTQLDAVLTTVAASTGEVEQLVDWLERFARAIPQGIPGDFAQVYAWFVEEGH